MRNPWFAVLLAALTACASSPPRPQPTAPSELAASLESGLVLHFTFDEQDGTAAKDSSGTGNDGTYQGTTVSTEAAPLRFANPRSRRFGSHSAVSAPDSPSLSLTGPMTVAVRVRSTNPDIKVQEAVIEKWEAVPLPERSPSGSTVTSKHGFMLRIDTSERPKFSVIAEVGASTGAVSQTKVPVGVWCP